MIIEENSNTQISNRILKRLPVYYYFLQSIEDQNQFISSSEIAKRLNLSSIQVRKDFATVDIEGKPRCGYNINDLIVSLKSFLGWDNFTEAVLVGTGKIGSSLMAYKDLINYGVNITVAFDSDARKTGIAKFGIPVHPIDQFNHYTKNKNIELGIITVPDNRSQEVADLMVNSNINVIWNFSKKSLTVQDSVFVLQHDMSPDLAILLNKVKNNRQTDGSLNKKQDKDYEIKANN